MKVAIHQPNYLPYIGFFQKMAIADIFVILDNVQFSRSSFTQRVKVRTKEGWMWMTIPIERMYDFHQIKDICLPKNTRWMEDHRKSIRFQYSKSKYLDDEFVGEYFGEPDKYKKLQEFNETGIFYLKDEFGIDTDIIRATELGIDSSLRSTDLLVDIVERTGGSTYISGTGGRNYLDASRFAEHNIDLAFFEFTPMEYSQRWGGFEPYMSSIDLLFNMGPGSRDLLKVAGPLK